MFSKLIDRFCRRWPRFGVPRLMMTVAVGQLLVYLLSMIDRSGYALYNLAFIPRLVLQGEVWRVVTWVLLPTQSSIIWMALYIYFCLFISQIMDNAWGRAKFSLYYLFGVLLHVLYGFAVYALEVLGVAPYNSSGYMALMTSQFLNFSVFFALASVAPDNRVLLFFVIPVKMKWLALIDLGYFVYYTITLPFPVRFVPAVALLGFLLFCGGGVFARFGITLPKFSIKRSLRRRRHKPSKNEYNDRFCAVCGKRAADYPQLEFRFCSQCEGLHCYCEEHIRSHMHFVK